MHPAPGLGDLPHGRPLQSEFDDGLDYPRLGTVSFRRGTLTANQQAAWEEHWPRLGRVMSDERIDVADWFGRSGHPTIVEIGSGTGTSTVAMAPLEADTNIIAVELYKPGLAKMMGAALREGIENIRMVRGDGVEVLNRMIAPGSLDGVRIFFPDPWPKARHHKRRIIQSGPLHLIATRLKPGGVLHVATDHADYAEWISELVDVEPLLRYRGWPWAECPVLTDRQVRTKFEGRGLRMEHSITEFLWERVDDADAAPSTTATDAGQAAQAAQTVPTEQEG
ncbi:MULTISPECIES: tRNA (guanosine(46)-N7)-methyltransferase TrmB [unclassified Corynebacterium]|uniref:tRNA (guanosine(46)-N7)-methyltransferase TrmB n=1 Tax=unclassified Corynebacterium TaxID=2624378 RepID=UPI0029C9FBAC|nr:MULTISPECIES: tRNA (guanosine(46)-N7)-methyltransferase TrmB [unclassified Corynebacterium]WPF67317.1 tRNA (guanosine(46)-N7)-methyltransferase TrmB [Corynebacterium sp. 22KM0430]WPF69808.1 tRNA (guanosine(46)-N7)-methyltransferase TrmB [Corynebacterium sp. 21KM1197]